MHAMDDAKGESSQQLAELVKQNATLRRQLEDTKLLLSNVTEQIQEVMTVNHAVTVQLEQTSDVRKYLSGISSDFGASMSECGELVAELEGGGADGGAPEAGGADGGVSSRLVHAELKKLHARNLELERLNAESKRVQAQQRSHILRQDRWVKQLSNVVASLSQKLEEKGDTLRDLIQSQVETTNQLHQSESTLTQLSQVNKELFAKLKTSLARAGAEGVAATGRGPTGGDMLQKVLGENLQLRTDLKKVRDELGRRAGAGAGAEGAEELVARNRDLEDRLAKMDRLRKATNKRAHELAQEKDTMSCRIQQQRETIFALRKQIGRGGAGGKRSGGTKVSRGNPKWKR